MKKLLFLLILILPLNVNSKQNDIENKYYILEFENYTLSTNNVERVLQDIQIIWIQPYDGLDKKYLYENIHKFKQKYYKILENYNYNKALEFNVSGVFIKKIKVYSDLNKLNKLSINLNFKIK